MSASKVDLRFVGEKEPCPHYLVFNLLSVLATITSAYFQNILFPPRFHPMEQPPFLMATTALSYVSRVFTCSGHLTRTDSYPVWSFASAFFFFFHLAQCFAITHPVTWLSAVFPFFIPRASLLIFLLFHMCASRIAVAS